VTRQLFHIVQYYLLISSTCVLSVMSFYWDVSFLQVWVHVFFFLFMFFPREVFFFVRHLHSYCKILELLPQ